MLALPLSARFQTYVSLMSARYKPDVMLNFEMMYSLIECPVVGFINRGYSIDSKDLYKLVKVKIKAAKSSKQ